MDPDRLFQMRGISHDLTNCRLDLVHMSKEDAQICEVQPFPRQLDALTIDTMRAKKEK